MATKKVIIKVGEILTDANIGLRAVLEELAATSMPPRYAIPIRKLRAAVAKEFQELNPERLKLFQQFGWQSRPCAMCKTTGQLNGKGCSDCGGFGYIKDERSSNWQVSKLICGDKWEDFVKAFNELMLTDTEFESPIIDLPESINIQPVKLDALWHFMVEEDPVAEAERIVKRG